MPGQLQINMRIRDTLSNALKKFVPFMKSRARPLAKELERYALAQASKTVFGVYNAYEPVKYARTYQLMEGVSAVGYYSSGIDISLSFYNTAKNRDSRSGQLGFPYPYVVEFGQGSGARSPQEVADTVARKMGDSQEAIFVPFAGNYGWHEMPPRPSLIPATIATGNYLYHNRLGKLLDTWINETGTVRQVNITFRR